MLPKRLAIKAQMRAIKMAYISAASVAAVFITSATLVDALIGQTAYGNILWSAAVAVGSLSPMFIALIVGVLRYKWLCRDMLRQEAARADEITHDTISTMVDTFYHKIKSDGRLGPIFTDEIGETEAAWAPHLTKMKQFWRSVLLGEHVFKGNPMQVHAQIPNLSDADFELWLTLFRSVVSDMFQHGIAEEISRKAERIARSLNMGYDFYNQKKAVA